MRKVVQSLVLLVVLLAWPLAAQDRPPLVSSVDITVPVAPSVVRIGGRPVVAYELHLTNFQAVGVALSRVQVLPAAGTGVIADYSGDELKKRLGRPGLTRPYDAPEIIGAGLRAVVYLWIELPEAAPLPAGLRHRIELEVRRPAGAVSSAVAGAVVALAASSPVVLDPPLRGGPWTAIYDPLLMGGHRTAIYTLDGRARIPSRFAIDWIRLPADGTAVMDGAPRAADWNGYGDEVLAVADATVARAMDDIAENPDPPVAARRPDAARDCQRQLRGAGPGGRAVRVLRAPASRHRRGEDRRSREARPGDRAARQLGSSSIGPHLHFHVADAVDTLGAEGLPFVFREFELLGAFASIDAVRAGGAWQRRPQPDRRSLEHPAANSVLRFP